MSSGQKTLALRFGGALLFILGLALAMQTTPEWKVRDTPSPESVEARFDEIAEVSGYEVSGPKRKTSLRFGSSQSDINIRQEAVDRLGSESTAWVNEQGLALMASTEALVRHQSGREGLLNVAVDMNGNTISIEFTTNRFGDFVKPGTIEVKAENHVDQARLLLRPGEQLGEAETATLGAQKLIIFPIGGADPPESISAVEPPGIRLVNRRPGTPKQIDAFFDDFLAPSRIASRVATFLLRAALVLFFGALFIVLAVRRNIDLRTGLLVGLVVLVVTVGSTLDTVGADWIFWMRVAFAALISAWCVVVWSSAESWLRSVRPEQLHTLDTLASFRPGPKSGAALLDGWFAGLGIAGILLLVESSSTVAGLLSSTSAAIDLPMFGATNAISTTLLLSGAILASATLAHYFKGRTEALVGTALAALVILPVLDFSSEALALVVALVLALILRWMLVRGGAAAVLASCLTFLSAPAAVFALRHSDWLGVSAASASVLALFPLTIGLIGSRRPAEIETQEIITPRFMRRLSEERRVQYEMGLLAEMQVKLLPDTAPEIDGWDIAANSVLASEVGGDLYDYLEDEEGELWVAIGDVSGHGYQCAIAQAMTKAALTSLVSADHTPSELLARIDKVLRRGGSARTFTSLALARIDVKTGKVTLSNAGNPYPVHVTVDGRTNEIEMPSLPLGMGPARTYHDVEIALGPRDYLVFYSDGLVEVRNKNDEELGFEKPASIVRMRRGQSSEELVAALEKAWRDHLGEGEIQDDTTVVVVRRNS